MADHRSLSLVIVSLLMIGADFAHADECPGMFGGTDRLGKMEFYKNTNFGTIGILADQNPATGRVTRRIIAPKPTVTCLSLQRPRRSIYVIFNHRNSEEAKVGYASFKIYGLRVQSGEIPVLWVERKGSWTRNGQALKPQPYESGVVTEKIAAYERYYGGDSTASAMASFDGDFGKIHGQPEGSSLMSWSGINLMQPTKLGAAQTYQKVDYLQHNLQRFETVEGWAPPGKPVGVNTTKIASDALLISVYSPLNRSVHHTLLVKFN